MFDCILKNKPRAAASVLPRKTLGWHNRAATLLGATTLVSLSLTGLTSMPAAAQQQKP